MKEILQNLALLETMSICKANNIDCSGTHIYKYPKRYIYALVDSAGLALVTIAYYKNRVPSHVIANYYPERIK